MLEPAGVVPDDVLDRREAPRLPQGDELVNLLLVLADDDPDAGVVEHMVDLVDDAVGVQADRAASKRLRSELGDHPLGPVVAEDRQRIATAEAQLGKPRCEPAHPAVVLGPRRRLPDPEALFLERDAPVAVTLGELGQELREGIRRLRRHAARCSPRYASITAGLSDTSAGSPSAIT